ncbi:MAG: ABC transporter ATP-binding protein [Candidatus Pacebacteria bacterium]|nr:ABC transporter ATP-binding protein [Candidatus Paceibacterota bacterium]
MKGLAIDSYLKRMRQSIAVYRWVYVKTMPKQSKKHLKKMLVPMFFYEACGMTIPLFFGLIIDAISHQNRPQVAWLFIGITVSMITRLILHQWYMIEREHIKGYNEAALTDFITRALFAKSIGQHIRHKRDLNQASMHRAQSSIRYLTSLMLFEGITSTYLIVLSFCFIWFLAPFAGVVLTIALALYLFGSLLMNKSVIEVYSLIDNDLKRHHSRLEESWEKAPRILSLGKGDDIASSLNRHYHSVNDRSRAFWIGFIKKITYKDLINVCALVIVWGFYIYRASTTRVVDTQAIGFLLPLFSWSWSTVNSIWRIGHIEQEFNWALPTISKLKDALEMTPDVRDVNPKVLGFDTTPIIEFRNVSFGYSKKGSTKETLRDISFTINPGEKLALIGASGAGKTTLAKLLQRAYDTNTGSILINDYDIREVSIDAWRSVVGEIPQQIDIFDGTLRDNLLIAINSEVHDQYPDELLQTFMGHFAIDFCELDTKVGPKGVWLSGGQQQRIAAAQIAIKNAHVFIIDEATSSLDATTEKEVQLGLSRLLEGNKSALVVAHNLSTVRNICNKFIVLRSLSDTPAGESQIEAQGASFEEVYPQSPILRRLMSDQGLSLENKKVAIV